MGYFVDLRLTAGVCFLPKERADQFSGEDAYFICDGEQTFGVADGVSGWVGIKPGVYSAELMGNASQFVQNRHSIYGGVDPVAVLNHAFAKSISRGLSTACIITLTDNMLHAVNVGDSGFGVIRGGKVVYKSPVQLQRGHFNCPFQLGVYPRGNTPDDADEIRFEVEPGDVIVAATDGLWDNMFDEELEWLVTDSLEKDSSLSPESMACHLGTRARMASHYDDEVSPFSLAATKAGRDRDIYNYMGGRYDDVTVIVGFID